MRVAPLIKASVALVVAACATSRPWEDRVSTPSNHAKLSPPDFLNAYRNGLRLAHQRQYRQLEIFQEVSRRVREGCQGSSCRNFLAGGLPGLGEVGQLSGAEQIAAGVRLLITTTENFAARSNKELTGAIEECQEDESCLRALVAGGRDLDQCVETKIEEGRQSTQGTPEMILEAQLKRKRDLSQSCLNILSEDAGS